MMDLQDELPPEYLQYSREVSLIVTRPEIGGKLPAGYVTPNAIDLSAMHFRFETAQQDVESPNNCFIRIWNLKEETIATLLAGEFSRVVLQAGYKPAGIGVIFDGTIKQYRIGRENQTDTYFDLLAADGDPAYNFATVNQTLGRGWTQQQALATASKAMVDYGVATGNVDAAISLGGTVPAPRGKVLFGLARVQLRNTTDTLGATWSIDNGVLNVWPLKGYKPNAVVELNAQSGLIGRVEQTTTGMIAKCLLNPRIEVAGRVRINNRSINRLINAKNNSAGLPYNKRAAPPVMLASEATDGIYRVFVAEHEGDTRGEAWYTTLTCLAIDEASKKVKIND